MKLTLFAHFINAGNQLTPRSRLTERMIAYLLKIGLLVLLPFGAIAEVDLKCMSECSSRSYARDFCSERCSYTKGGASGSGGYQPEYGLGAVDQGQAQADREMLQQLKMLKESLAIQAEVNRQRREREQYEQEQQVRAEQRQRYDQAVEIERKVFDRSQQLRATLQANVESRRLKKKTKAASNPNYEKGRQLLNNGGDLKKAFSLFQKAATEGYAPAQFLVGSFYEGGVVVVKSDSEAVSWYRKSAEMDDPAGAHALGLAYLTGKGIEKNVNEGFRWTKYAAENGNFAAQFTLGSLYANGTGTSHQNEVEAHAWIRVSAESGYAPSQRILGKIYLTGMGVRKDERQGFDWLEKAAKQGDSEALSIMKQALLSK